MASSLRAVIVDSDPEGRGVLRRLLSGTAAVSVVAEYADVEALLRNPNGHRLDVAVVEITDSATPVSRLVETLPDVAILATGPVTSADLVIQAIRAGALEYLRRPVEAEELTAALTKLLRVRRVDDARAPGRVTSVFSTKGGQGVTTLATNVAIGIAERKAGSVLLVELDTRASDVATFLDLRPSYSVIDALENITRLDASFLQGLLTRHTSGLAVLAAPTQLHRHPMSGEYVQILLDVIRASFDHVVLDLRHELDAATLAGLEASDTILFVTEPNVAALRSAAAGLAAFRHLGIDVRKVKPVLMRDGTGEEVTLKHAKEALDIPIFWRIPSDYANVVSAINRGRPVITSASRSKVATSLRQLAGSLGADLQPATGTAKRRASLLRFAFNPRT
jgi:pilus assembly protein CpaE